MSTLTRRRLLQGAGALVVGFSLDGGLRSIALAADEIPPNPNFNFEEQLQLTRISTAGSGSPPTATSPSSPAASRSVTGS